MGNVDTMSLSWWICASLVRDKLDGLGHYELWPPRNNIFVFNMSDHVLLALSGSVKQLCETRNPRHHLQGSQTGGGSRRKGHEGSATVDLIC